MPFDPNDPRLTAYALGELDESEIAAVEAELLDCAESRAAVEEIRATARLLTEELSRESGPGLATDQHATIAEQLATPPATISMPRRPTFLFLKLGLAAGLLGAIGLAYYSRMPDRPAAMVASKMTVAAAPMPPHAAANFAEAEEKIASEGLALDSAPPTPDASKVMSPAPADGAALGVNAGVKGEGYQYTTASRPIGSLHRTLGEAEAAAGRSVAARDLRSSGGEPRAEASGPIAGKPAATMPPGDSRTFDADTTPPPILPSPMAPAPAQVLSGLAVAPDSDLSKQKAPTVELEEAEVRNFQSVDRNGVLARQLAQNAEVYRPIVDNKFLRAAEPANRLSTFSIDVDTASYSNVRRFLNERRMPPPDAARIEELINYFPYDYPQPKGDAPFSISAEIGRCPWNAEHRLARIGLKGRAIDPDRRPASNLVFLVDVSGSMDQPNKLPLVKEGLRLLVERLGGEDRVAIVVYASRTGVELPSTELAKRGEILSAIDRLSPGGSTNGGAGIVLAYEEAAKHFIPNGTNRVILCTDGDFNVGVVDDGDLVRMIESRAKESKVFLSVLGFGVGDLKDSKMKALADHGNGNYAYIDTPAEARKVLVDQMSATLVTIAKDVKVQVEFNPARVGAYRLLGYENRLLRAEDFNDDAKDAGEIGAGHTVTALYEIVPPGKEGDLPGVDKLKYAKQGAVIGDPESKESMTVKLRFKAPEGDRSDKIEVPVIDDGREYPDNAADFQFAAAVAEFGMLLRNSPYKGTSTFAGVREMAEAGKGADPSGYRAGFIELVGNAEAMPRPLMRARNVK